MTEIIDDVDPVHQDHEYARAGHNVLLNLFVSKISSKVFDSFRDIHSSILPLY